MTLPNFLVIGAGRSGTTSLHDYLGQHPAVYLPAVKAPSHFYCRDRPRISDRTDRWVTDNYFVPDPIAYERLFDAARDERAVGEVSPVYLASVHTAARIAERLPDVKLIAVLRNPVDRAYARFVGRRRDGLERRSELADVLRDEQEESLIRDDAFATYIASGFCHHFLRSYYDVFPREQIRVFLFEDMVSDPLDTMASLYEFLGVDSTFVPNMKRRHNRSGGTIRNPILRALWTRSALARAALRSYLPAKVRDVSFSVFTRRLEEMPLEPALRDTLREVFREDTEKLGRLIDRDLSHWLV